MIAAGVLYVRQKMNKFLNQLKSLDPGDAVEADEIDGIYDLVDSFFQEQGKLDQNAQKAIIGLFEKFPTDYYSHVLWNIIHGLEHFGGYEKCLIDSVTNSPSCTGVVMVSRLLNGGFYEFEGLSYLSLLNDTSTRTDCSEEVSQRAGELISSYNKKQAEQDVASNL
ncbi:hypothetical protein HW115_18885 [Verrucomicrobiaceae bacterium N1E253]|uniref:Uncharacterized protein n=1 Tax=Oceaniferula marina TaxID=2748318 RepID=A0A851GP81_9BACT|nr:hypothetical protein [Oceaniferula marina]NWK57691.1 hypothetical protein [Oceaniferula marina]